MAVGLIAVLLGIVVVAVGPAYFEDRVEAELLERLDARGVDASWASFESAWGKTFVLRDVSLNSSAHGLSLTSERVRVSVATEALLSGEPRLSSIEVEGLRIDLDLDAGSSAPEDDSPREPPRAREEGQDLASRILRELPDVVVSDARLELRSTGTTHARIVTPHATIVVDRPRVRIDASSDLELVDPRFGFLAGQVVALQGGMEVDLATGSLELDWQESEAALIELNSEEVALRIDSIGASANFFDREGRVELGPTSFRAGGVDAHAALFSTEEAQIGLTGGRKVVKLSRPHFFVTPARLGELRGLFEIPSEGSPAGARGGSVARIERWGERISRVFDEVDFELAQGSLEVRVEREDQDPNDLEILERFDLWSRRGRVTAHARSAGGSIRAELALMRGRSLPSHLVLSIEDVDLGKIPGMPQARSKLPNRGTSGRLGGVVNMRAAMVAPTLGIGDHASFFDSVTGVVNLDWADGVIDLTGVSENPMTGIDLETHFELTWHPARARLQVNEGALSYGKVDVNFSAGVWDYPLETTFRIDAALEEVSCQDSIRAFPRALLGPYRRIELEGEWAPKLHFTLPIYRPRRLKLRIEDYEDQCEIKRLRVPKREWPDVSISPIAPTGPHRSVSGFPTNFDLSKRDDVYWLNRPFIKRVYEGVSDPEEVEVLVGPGLASYVPIHELPPWVGGAAYLSEQMRFYEDPAISVALIRKALRLNLEKGRFVYGGSTVTQQLVKNLFLSRDKTLSRKLREALISWRVTQKISKDRVLELYLNCIEFGPDVYGIGPAARYYFQKDARQLTPREAIFLAMLKPAPWYGAKVVRRRATPVTGYWANRTEELFGRLIDEGLITAEMAEAEKPYKLEWDSNGAYLDPTRAEAIFVPLDLP